MKKMILVTMLLFSVSGFTKGMGPCAEDMDKFCKDVKGRKEKMSCMHEHKDELSAACKEKGQMFKEKAMAAHEACKDDVEKFCKDVEKGEGRVIKCLTEHQAELSESCKNVHNKKMKK